MRILHIAATMRPGHDGCTRFLYRLRDWFKANTQDEQLFLAALVGKEKADDIITHPYSFPFPLYTDYQLGVGTASTIKRMVGNRRPDIVHLHTPCTLGHAGLSYAKKEGIPVVATYHTHFPAYLPYYHISALTGLCWSIQRNFYGKCDAVSVPTRPIVKSLEKNGISGNLIQIYPGVDTTHFSPTHRSEEWRRSVGGEGKTIFLFVGRLCWEKNLVAFVRAWKHLKNKDRARFVFVGEGPAREKFARMFPEGHLTGFVNEQTLYQAFASSDVFLFPSVADTFGFVNVEAFSSGLPIICVEDGGTYDVVDHERTGLIVRPNDDRALAGAVDRLIEDPELRKRLSKAAIHEGKKYTWQETFENHVKMYQQVYKNSLVPRASSVPAHA